MDASETVHEAWNQQERAEHGFKVTTGHTWITAGEIPNSVRANAAEALVEVLEAARERFGPSNARLVVWLRHDIET